MLSQPLTQPSSQPLSRFPKFEDFEAKNHLRILQIKNAKFYDDHIFKAYISGTIHPLLKLTL